VKGDGGRGKGTRKLRARARAKAMPSCATRDESHDGGNLMIGQGTEI
jgi:hypothetical protein